MPIPISFIIPTFNRSRILKQRVMDYLNIFRGVINLKFEIILVNDCSLDDTSIIISDLVANNSEIKGFHLPQNRGPGIARNHGLMEAEFEYIWFLDDDDCLDWLGVQKVIDLISSMQTDKFMVYGHSLLKKYSPSLSIGSRKNQILKNIILFREKQEVFNFIFRKSFLINNNILFSSGVHEDISFLVESLSISKNIEILDLQVYKKDVHEDAITFSMSRARIDGFLAAYNTIQKNNFKYHYFDFIDVIDFKAQIFGVICYLIVKSKNELGINLLKYYIEELKKSDLVSSLPAEFSDIDSNLKYAVSSLSNGIIDEVSVEILFEKIKTIFSSHLSCKDLDSSIFLGPNEVRACCKRFFVNGRQKGDVVLLPASPDIGLYEINLAKKKLISEINREESAVCSGCPYIERVHKGVDVNKINYISLENFSYCNMRCSYCSPKYYDGTEAIYNAVNIISELADTKKLTDDCHIVWGGGEPTLSPTFGVITELLLKSIDVGKVRVLSNSLKFSEKLSRFLGDSRVHLVTSIDAGRQETFKEIRGKGNIDLVLANLANYLNSTEDKSRVTIKYIFTKENFNSNELQEFVNKISAFGITSALFQISCDFRIENPEDKFIFGFYELASRLHSIGVKHVFFDDLIRDRVDITPSMADKVISHLNFKNLPTDRIYFYSSNSKVILWGKGLQSKWYSQNTSYGKSGKILAMVSTFSDLEKLEYSEYEIMPSGVQSIYEIIKNIKSSQASNNFAFPILL